MLNRDQKEMIFVY